MRKAYMGWIVAIFIVASWAYNFYAHEVNRLPEGRFLSHLIEVTDSPGDSFMLYYIANNDDKRLPVTISIEGLPTLQFYPISTYMTFRNQKLYQLIGQFNPGLDDTASEAATPMTIRSVDVNYSDGTREKSDIGKMIVYRENWRSGDSISGVNSSGLQPVAMRLRLEYTDEAGIEQVQMIPMERQPYPTEAAIREYVKAQRRAKE